MRSTIVGFLLVAALACGSSNVTEPRPVVVNGTINFSLTNCQDYATAEYVVDSTSVGIEPIVVGSMSQGYSVPSGRRTTIARVLKAGATLGLWTFRDVVQVPANGAVTANLVC